MTTGGQLGFGFDEGALALAAEAAAAKARKPKAAKPVAVAAVAPSAAPGDSPEAMALALERHPDYRVLRRLVPATEFDHSPLGPVARS
jgi:DNA polymerase-3 subunit epsilon